MQTPLEHKIKELLAPFDFGDTDGKDDTSEVMKELALWVYLNIKPELIVDLKEIKDLNIGYNKAVSDIDSFALKIGIVALIEYKITRSIK